MILVKCTHSGQPRPYADSVYRYEIESDEGPEAVKTHCLTEVRKVNPLNEIPGYHHNGSCGFPFGLASFYTFLNLEPAGKGYIYIVTCPYCD